MQHLKNTTGTRVSRMGDTEDREAGCENCMSSKAHGCRVQRAISLAVFVCVESHVERPIVIRATRRVIIVYSSLLRHAFAAPEFCLCRVTMATP